MVNSPSKEIVEVYNLNDEPYFEIFREEEIKIPAGGFVEMKRRKAKRFLGSFPPNDANDNMKVKMLSIRYTGRFAAPPRSGDVEHICHMDGKKFDTKAELDVYLKQFADRTVKPVKTIVCPLCKKEFDNTDVLLAHLEIHAEKKPDLKPVKFGNGKPTKGKS